MRVCVIDSVRAGVGGVGGGAIQDGEEVSAQQKVFMMFCRAY